MKPSVKKNLQNQPYSKDYTDGLAAIKNEHRKQIKYEDPRNLIGSLDIDKACKYSEPSASRWDYLIVVNKNNKENLAFIEIHPAKPGEVEVIIKKKEWLLVWISKTRLKEFSRSIIWVSTGGTKILPQSKYIRILAQNGISLPRSVTLLLDTEVEYK